MTLVHPRSPSAVRGGREDAPPESVAEVLERAAALIEPEGAWTQGTFARGKGGRPANRLGPAAVCFCMLGAIQRVTGDPHSGLADSAEDAVHKTVRRDIVAFNDDPKRTQAEAVAALRAAAMTARNASASRPSDPPVLNQKTVSQ